MLHLDSTRTIKPSYPTPAGLKNFKLIFFDQLVATLPAPVGLVYPSSTDHLYQKISSCKQLKKSLSLTLTEMYPLAAGKRISFSLNSRTKVVNIYLVTDVLFKLPVMFLMKKNYI